MYGSKVKAYGKRGVTSKQVLAFQRHAMQIRRATNHFNKDKRDRQLDYLYTKQLEELRDIRKGLCTAKERWIANHASEILKKAGKDAVAQEPEENDGEEDTIIIDAALQRGVGGEPPAQRMRMGE